MVYMAFGDDFDERLLERAGSRSLGWNLLLLLIVLVAAASVVAGLWWLPRRSAPPTAAETPVAVETPPVETGAAGQPAGDPVRDQWRSLQAELPSMDRLEIRQRAHLLLEQATDPGLVAALQDLVGEINRDLVFTPAAMPEKIDYVVQPGDALGKIARRYDTTVELIQRGNQLRGDLIRPGDRLRVFNVPFSVVLDKGRNELLVFAQDSFFKRYRVGTGKHGTTPAGIFVIGDKIVEPPWWRPDGKVVPFGDEENVLGTRWMSLTPVEGTDPVRGYGIHGTWEPETIGHQASAGCVRLLNDDVEELYALLPVGTRVVIRE
ncbi:MAG: L,D-transpeptidase family protein [Lentisphaerae bacterium]|nr:L,D-transpeptidase family protein [Lentisphaerota bacterium]